MQEEGTSTDQMGRWPTSRLCFYYTASSDVVLLIWRSLSEETNRLRVCDECETILQHSTAHADRCTTSLLKDDDWSSLGNGVG